MAPGLQQSAFLGGTEGSGMGKITPPQASFCTPCLGHLLSSCAELGRVWGTRVKPGAQSAGPSSVTALGLVPWLLQVVPIR